MRHAATLEQVLLALGAADEYDAVAQVIVDGARQLTDAVLATLAAPASDGVGSVVTASGGLAAATADDPGIDVLPVYTFSLATGCAGDETPPLLRLHGDHLTADPPTELIARFAPHARVALARPAV